MNKGNPAANEHRIAVLSDIADAATGLNASTRYVNTDWNAQMSPHPNGIVETCIGKVVSSPSPPEKKRGREDCGAHQGDAPVDGGLTRPREPEQRNR